MLACIVQRDTFYISAPYAGKVRAVRIRFAPHVRSDDWHLDRVVVQCAADGEVITFPCGKWFTWQKFRHIMYPEGTDPVASGTGEAGAALVIALNT